MKHFLVAVFGLCLAMVAWASGPSQPLPEFAVVDASGNTVGSADVVSETNWAILYVQANNRPSEMLLSQLRGERYQTLSSKLVVIVSGIGANDVSELARKYPDLANARWYCDPNRAAAAKLQLGGVPVQIGLHGNTVRWKLNGALVDGAKLNSMLTDWLGDSPASLKSAEEPTGKK